jgi:ElaB/YqjD/DUF883 family membrane-anchored ribosome-binding protein
MNDSIQNDPDATNRPTGPKPPAGSLGSTPHSHGRDPLSGTQATDTADTTDLADRNPDALEHDIRRTRADISGTIDQIEARLSPAHLKHEAMSAVHQTIDQVQDRLDPRHLVHNAKRSMIDTVRDNPVPSIIAGLSLGYLIFSGSDDDRERRAYRRYTYASGYPAAGYRTGPQYRSAQPAPYPQGPTMRTGVAYEQHSAGSSDYDSNGQSADGMRDRAQDAADQAKEQVQHLAHGAEQQMYRAKSGLEQFVEDNPLAAGALAAGLGALLGGLFPTTPQENRLMGEASDQLMQQAKQAAESTLGEAKEAVETVVSDAKDEAQNAEGSLGDKAKQVLDRAETTARDEAENVKQTAKSEAQNVTDEARSQADSSGDSKSPIAREVSTV